MMQASNICIHVGNCRNRITRCNHLLGLLYFLWGCCFCLLWVYAWLIDGFSVAGLLSYKTGYQVHRWGGKMPGIGKRQALPPTNEWLIWMRCWRYRTLTMAMAWVHTPVPRCPGWTSWMPWVRNRARKIAWRFVISWDIHCHSQKLMLFAPVKRPGPKRKLIGKKPGVSDAFHSLQGGHVIVPPATSGASAKGESIESRRVATVRGSRKGWRNPTFR